LVFGGRGGRPIPILYKALMTQFNKNIVENLYWAFLVIYNTFILLPSI